MQMASDTQRLLTDTAERLFSDHCDKAMQDRAETGQFPAELWQLLVQNGFHTLADISAETALADVFALLKVAGRHALPLPLAETLLARRWLDYNGEGLLSVGELSGQEVINVPWGRSIEACLAVSSEGELYRVEFGAITVGVNLAGEARDHLHADQLNPVACSENPWQLLALARAAASAGALERVLELCLQYAGERTQFGKPIAAFQAIQHSLAVMAGHVAAASHSVDAAIAMLGSERAGLDIAAAKARTAQASTLVAEQAHQVHGAIGFTYEHRLHHLTRRLWAWREEFRNEAWWQTVLGQHICEQGADDAWKFIASRF